MKKMSRPDTNKSAAFTSFSVSGTCVYFCDEPEWMLVEDRSNPGYYCENTYGACSVASATIEVDALPEEESGETAVSMASRARAPASKKTTVSNHETSIPKNAALYRYVRQSKKLRRVRGAWSKGQYAPLEMTLKELAKFAPNVSEIVSAMAKNKAVASFQVIVPAQKIPKTSLAAKSTRPAAATKSKIVSKKGTSTKKNT